jgi:hypothetical protein
VTQQKWPGYGQDGEDRRLRQERQRERQIQAENLSARIRAADPVQRDRIDPAIGRTFGDAAARGLYDDDARLRDFRGMNERNRQQRERFRWAQARTQGRRGRN